MITMFVTSQNGDGFVDSREYDSWEDITIRTEMYSNNVVITFEEEINHDRIE